MALPPTIPTSFVPKQPVAAAPRHRVSGANPFLALAYFVTGLAVVGCLVVFGYQLYLENVAKKKANDVVNAQNAIDQATVSDFIRLRDRFTEAQGVLNHHVMLSQYFNVLEQLTLQDVRFVGLKLNVSDDRSGSLTMSGVAKNFNALAAQSAAFANDKRIKRAIFSGITVSPKDNSVTFTLTAELDPSLVMQGAAGTAAAVTTTPPPSEGQTPAASTTTAATTTTP